MTRLKCGCVPDASGYGYCSECSRKLREKVWKKMSEDKKNYDRHFAPDQSAALDGAMQDYESESPSYCSCHISAPCSYCLTEGETDNSESR